MHDDPPSNARGLEGPRVSTTVVDLAIARRARSSGGMRHIALARRDHDPITATISDTVARTGISRATLYRLAGSGRIRLVKVGRRSLVVWASVLDYLDSLPAATIRKAA